MNTKIIDLILIAFLGYNIFNTVQNYTPTVSTLGLEAPTWLAITLQALCILLLGYRLIKPKRA